MILLLLSKPKVFCKENTVLNSVQSKEPLVRVHFGRSYGETYMCIHYGVYRTWLGAFCYLFHNYKIKTVQSFMKLEKIKNWVSTHKIISGTIFVILIGIGFSSGKNTPQDQKVATDTPAQQEVEQKMVFDVPSYFGKSIEDIEKAIGTPTKDTSDRQKEMGIDSETADREFSKDGYTLAVEYNIKSRKVISFFVDKKGDLVEKDRSILAKVSNVNYEDKTYSAKFVQVINEPEKFTGLSIKSKQVVIDEWDELVKKEKQAGIIYKDEKEIGGVPAYYIYVDRNWYLLKVDMKKDLVAKFSNLKKDISGLANVKFKDSNSDEVVAEFSSFSGINIYK